MLSLWLAGGATARVRLAQPLVHPRHLVGNFVHQVSNNLAAIDQPVGIPISTGKT
jgi:hypothetical protein